MNRTWGGGFTIGLAIVSAALLVLGGTAHGAGTQRFTSTIAPLLDGPTGSAIGSVSPGTLLDVVEQSGDRTHVTLGGWSSPKAGGVIYAAPDRQIVELSGFKGRASTGASRAVGGTTYTAVTIDGWVATSVLVDDLQPIWSNAATLYAQKCGTCHAVPDAGSNSVADWPDIVRTWAPSANLTPAQTALITAYLQAQSKN